MRFTAVIELRLFQSTDTPFFAGMAGDSRVTRFVGDGQPWQDNAIHARVSAALDLVPLERSGSVRWFIAEESGEPVGLVVSTRRESAVEIGYWVSPEHWGKGVAGAMVSEAVIVIPELFSVRSLVASVDPANVASVRILSRLGFTPGASKDGLDQYERNI